MVALVYTFDPKILPEGAGRGAGALIASVVQWKEKSPGRGRPKFDRFYIFLGRIRSSEAAMGGEMAVS
jgi:hypothetical protein